MEFSKFLEILQRLLPFTTRNGDSTEFTILRLVGSDIIITVFILTLLFIAIRGIISVRRSIKIDNIRIQKFKQLFLDVPEEIEQKHAYLSQLPSKVEALNDKQIAALWRDFSQSLVVEENEFSSEIELFRTVDSGYFFNSKTLLSDIKSKTIHNVPSMLLGIGLIGTFFGLFYGLVPLNLEDSNVVKESMNNLIRAAGAKFASSIWGLVLSVAFTAWLKRHETKLEKEVAELQEIINSTYEIKSAEGYLSALKSGISIQSDNINQLSSNIAEQLGSQISQSLVDAIKQPLDKLAENIGGSREQTLYSRLDALSGGIGDDFSLSMKNMMNEILREIRQSMGNDTDNMKETLASVTNLLISLKENIERQQQGAQQATKDTFEALAKGLTDIQTTVSKQNLQLENTLESLNTHITGLIGKINEQNSQLAQSSQSIASNATNANHMISQQLETLFTNLSEKMNEQNNQLAQSSQNIANNVENTNKIISQQVETLFTHLSEKMNEQSKQLEQSSQNIVANAANANQIFSQQVESLFVKLELSLNNIVSLIEKSKQELSQIPSYLDSFAQSTHNLESASENTHNAINNLSKASYSLIDNQDKWKSTIIATNEKLDVTLANFRAAMEHQQVHLAEIPESLERSIQKIKEISAESHEIYHNLANSYSDLLDKNSLSTQRFSESVENYRQNTESAVSEYQSQSTKYIESTFGVFDKHLSEFASQLAGAVNELSDALSDLSDEINNSSRR